MLVRPLAQYRCSRDHRTSLDRPAQSVGLARPLLQPSTLLVSNSCEPDRDGPEPSLVCVFLGAMPYVGPIAEC
ncbi:MAG: hypothetical protein AAF411_05840 [Myxococcota bacterium]